MTIKHTFSVSQLSKKAGISVRTLHHYDQTGLLKPNRRKDNGYREYNEKHLVLLQQILIYRELDFSIAAIKDMIYTPNIDLLSALENQKQMLLQRQQTTQAMINSIEVTMGNLKANKIIDIMYEGIPTEKAERWKTMSQERETEQERALKLEMFAKLTEEAARTFKNQHEEFILEYKTVLKHPISSDDVQQKILTHYNLINSFLGNFIDDYKGMSHDGYLFFAHVNTNFEEVLEYYEYYESGLSEHLSEAIIYFSEKKLKNVTKT